MLRQVARGGMGEVFLAATGGIVGAERPCIVKIIRQEHAEDSSFLARFLDEARVQAQLPHPGIAQVIEASTDRLGKPYVVVEYVEGRHLGEVRSRALQLGLTPSWPDAVAIGISICDALAYMHEQTDALGTPLEIAHRDISPQNVMVGYGGDVKLIDFGTARAGNRRCQTVAGVVFAKPGYIAPEVANNNPGGAPADLYALGIMLWELLAGQRFLEGDASEHLEEIAAGRRNPTRIAHLVDAPGVLDDIILRLTRPRPEDRIRSAREATSELVDLLKRAPSLAGGQRSVRERVAQLMHRLYPTEPSRSRREFARLVAQWQSLAQPPTTPLRPPTQQLPQPQPTLDAPTRPMQEGSTAALESKPQVDSETPDDEDALPGTRYRLLRELGRGGMGIVHEAYHVDLGRSVALKVLPRPTHESARRSHQLRHEARLIAQLSHENLVRLHDFGVTSDGRPFYAMELLRGRTVERWMREVRTVEWREALRVGIQACRALEAAHAAGVVHRDIKPSNLFLTESGTLKLLDFGIALRGGGLDTRGPGGVTGTPEYMSPEQATGGEADERSDLYSLGVVLYEMLTGQLPHRAQNTATLLELKQRPAVMPPGRCVPRLRLPKAVDTAVLKALSRVPTERYASAREMLEALSWAALAAARRRSHRRAMGFAALTAVMFGLASGTVIAARNPEIRARADATTRPWLEKLNTLSERLEARRGRLLAARASSPDPQQTAVTSRPDQERTAAAPAREAATDDESLLSSVPFGAELSGKVNAAQVAETQPSDGIPDSDSVPVADGSGRESIARDGDQRSSPPVAATAPDKAQALEAELARAIELGQTEHKIRSLNMLRRLGKRYPEDARVLKAWSAAAVSLGGWGEALRVARQWASAENGPEANVELARLQRATGRGGEAKKTLARVLEHHPGYEPAQRLRDEISPRRSLAAAP